MNKKTRAHIAGQIAAAIVGQWYEEHSTVFLIGDLEATETTRKIIADYAVALTDDLRDRLKSKEKRSHGIRTTSTEASSKLT